jgi:hypothetical protein
MLVDPQRVGEIGKESPNEPSGTHRWVARKTAGLKRTPQTPASPLLHYAPAIVYDATTGEWYAAFPRMFDFERLDSASMRLDRR